MRSVHNLKHAREFQLNLAVKEEQSIGRHVTWQSLVGLSSETSGMKFDIVASSPPFAPLPAIFSSI